VDDVAGQLLAVGRWAPELLTPAAALSKSNQRLWGMGMPFGVHIDLVTSMANLEGLFLPPRYPRPPGAPPW
jgi:hypothetical protein